MMILPVLLVVALHCTAASALKCVVCTSPEFPECADPINSTQTAKFLVSCAKKEFCRKITYKDEGESHVDRTCAELPHGDQIGCDWEIRVDSRIGSGWNCFCDRDGCNSASGVAATALLTGLAAVVLLPLQ